MRIATRETSQIESGDPGDPKNRVRRPRRPQKSSPTTLETLKVESDDQQRCCLIDSNVAVSETAALLSLRQQRCCLRDSKVAASEAATLAALTQKRCWPLHVQATPTALFLYVHIEFSRFVRMFIHARTASLTRACSPLPHAANDEPTSTTSRRRLASEPAC